MKKAYISPSVFVEVLTVNSFVAGSCASTNIVGYSESTCTYHDPGTGYTFFSSQCTANQIWGIDIVNPNPNSPFATLCYHRPNDSMSFFAS